MRRYVFILLFCGITKSIFALSYHAINIDYQTIAAMTAAYTLEQQEEKEANVALDSIVKSYASAGLSTASIFLYKQKERNALRDAGLFSSEENFYYKRIIYLVSQGIMPKLVVVASKMIKAPQEALYWGPYLFKTTTNVEDLCKQFEFVVTNGKLSFKDVTFLVVNKNLQKIFDLSKIGDIDWKKVLDQLGDFNIKDTENAIKSDVNNVAGTIKNISTAGVNAVDGDLSNMSSIGRIFKASPDEILALYDKFSSTYKAYRDTKNIKEILMQVIGSEGAAGVSRLFQIDNYNIAGYISNYIKELQDQYYRQHWYIYAEDSGSKTLCNYAPTYNSDETNYDGSWYGSSSNWDKEWTNFGSSSKHTKLHNASADIYKPSSTELSQVKSKSETVAGWSQSKVQQYNSQNNGHEATITYTLQTAQATKKNGHSSYYGYTYFAYAIKVIDVWNSKHTVYEETFDSQTGDLTTFKNRLQAMVDYYNSLEEDKAPSERVEYHLGFDEEKYYSEADKKKMEGCNSVSFTTTCDGGTELAKGSFVWKENGKQGSHLEDPASEDFAMRSTSSSNADDSKNELQSKITEYTNEVNTLTKEIQNNEQKRRELLGEIQTAKLSGNPSKANTLQNQYDELSNEQESLKQQLETADNNKSAANNSLSEYYDDMSDELDGPYRIPSNMQELEGMYQITWSDEGQWITGDEYYMFVRHGYSSTIKDNVTYTATLSLKARPKYFIGIRIHRAQLEVDYKLSSSYGDNSTVATLQLDMSKSSQERADEVNAKMEELKEDYPDCSISIKYNYANNISEENDDDTVHLLWASDRLDVARKITGDLEQIYAQLVLIDHVLTDKETIEDFFKHKILNLVVTREGRSTIAEYALDRWQAAGEEAKSMTNTINATNNNKQ